MEENFDLPKNNDKLEYTITNLLVMILSKFIQVALDNLTRHCNITPEKQPLINMKSEFLFKIAIYTRNKKQYITLIVLKEGNIVDPPDPDLKGINIKKATVCNKSKEFFNELITTEFFSDNIDIGCILHKLQDFEGYIRDSLENGKIEFTKPTKLNEFNSYEFPYRMQQVRGALLWNELYPNQPIVPPTKVNLIKLKGETLDELAPIYNLPEFETIKKFVFDSKSELANYGITCLSLPKSVEKIPDWAIKLIDKDDIVDDNIRNCNILLNSLGLNLVTYRGAEYYTNFLSF